MENLQSNVSPPADPQIIDFTSPAFFKRVGDELCTIQHAISSFEYELADRNQKRQVHSHRTSREEAEAYFDAELGADRLRENTEYPISLGHLVARGDGQYKIDYHQCDELNDAVSIFKAIGAKIVSSDGQTPADIANRLYPEPDFKYDGTDLLEDESEKAFQKRTIIDMAIKRAQKHCPV